MLPYLKFDGRGDQAVITDCVMKLEPLLQKTIEANSELTTEELEEGLTLIKRLETTMTRLVHPSEEAKRAPSEEVEKAPAAAPESGTPAMEMLTLSFDVDWDSKEHLVKLRNEIATVYTSLPQFSFGDQADNNKIRVNMKYLLPLLDKAIDVDDDEPPQAKDFRDSELRRVATLLEQVIFKPFINKD